MIVVVLALGPSIAHFAGRQAPLSYLLASLLFILAICTRYPLGVFKVVGLSMHGMIELIFAVLLLILPWILNFSRGILSRNFYMAIGVLMLVLWALTDFRGVRDRVQSST